MKKPSKKLLKNDPYVQSLVESQWMKSLLNNSSTKGYHCKVYVVGGFVRDTLLGKDGVDLDLIIEGIPFNDLVSILEKLGEVDLVGKSYYVIKFKVGAEHYDITIPRTDRNTGSGHKGFDVTPCDTIEEDLGRRDFTINAMAYDIHNHVLVDPYEGLRHLEERQIEVTYPMSFIEDPLRILRALRFACRYDFKLSLSTHCLLTPDTISLLSDISKERVIAEITKLQTDLQRQAFCVLWHNYGISSAYEIDSFMTPEDHIAFLTSGAFVFNLPTTIYYLLLSNLSIINSFPIEKQILKRIDIFDKAISITFGTLDKERVEIRDVMNFLMLYDKDPTLSQHEYFNGFFDPKKLTLTKELAVNGNDIVNSGVIANEQVGKVLTALRTAIYLDKVQNERNALLQLLQEL